MFLTPPPCSPYCATFVGFAQRKKGSDQPESMVGRILMPTRPLAIGTPLITGNSKFPWSWRREERNVQMIPTLQFKHQFPALFLPPPPTSHPIATPHSCRCRAGDLHHSMAPGGGSSRRTGSILALASSPKEDMITDKCPQRSWARVPYALWSGTHSTLPVPTCLSKHILAPGFQESASLEELTLCFPLLHLPLKQPEYFYQISMSPRVLGTQSKDACPSEEMTIVLK